MELFLVVFINIVFVIYFYNQSKKLRPISEHIFHVNLINRIKLNKNKVLKDHIFSYDEKNLAYPQYYHKIISYFPRKFYESKYYLINTFIKLIDLVFFNLFLIYLQVELQISFIGMIFGIIIYNIIPFTNAGWNAKIIGLSTRPLGLLLGQLYCYNLFFYFYSDNIIYILILIVVSFIVVLMSQFAFQFILLSSIIFAILFSNYTTLILPFTSVILYIFINKDVAFMFFKGQYNHKRNYALFMSEIYLFHYRYSVFRDFIYDFWLKLYKNPLKDSIKYIGMNPILEIIYGIPFIIFLFDFGLLNNYSNLELILFKFVIVGLILLLLTSFRKTRFLGEPSRYVEFISPFALVIFISNYSLYYFIGLSFYSVLMIIAMEFYTNKIFFGEQENKEKIEILNYFRNKYNHECLVTSNEVNLSSLLSTEKVRYLSNNLTNYCKNEEEFYSEYENKDKRIINRCRVKYFLEHFNVEFIVVNNLLYKISDIQSILDININFVEEYKTETIELYKVEYK